MEECERITGERWMWVVTSDWDENGHPTPVVVFSTESVP
jgi:hypothetical protein